jgi:hypothetical protein
MLLLFLSGSNAKWPVLDTLQFIARLVFAAEVTGVAIGTTTLAV